MTPAVPAIIAAAAILFAASSLHRADAESARQTVFQHQACVDCPVMRVNYYAPKP